MLENDNTVLIKRTFKRNVKFRRNTHLIETSYDRLKSREITFSNTGKILLKQEFSDGLQISMNIKAYYYTFLIAHYYLLRAFRTLHKFFHANHNVRFLPCQHRGVGIMQYVRAKPCVHRFNYSRTLPQRSSPSGLWTG